jgi:hypothetical protein
MKPFVSYLLTLIVCCSAAGAEEYKRLALFNGKDLNDWQQLGNATWQVKDGMILGGQEGDPKRSGLLTTRLRFQDFDLKLDFMIDEHGKYNSGVYLRNRSGKYEQTGYQINIGRAAVEEYVGLHMNEWLDKGDEKDAFRKVLAWNVLRIRAVGPHIQAWLNGTQIVDYIDPNPKPEHLAAGVLAFQTYGADGHSGWVAYRNLSIIDLSK